MTYSLLVQDGDLAVLGSECQIVTGNDKLRQDLTLWLTIAVGSNRFHPTFGSALQSYIGSTITSATQANAYNEVLRVLTNYQSLVYNLFTANPNIFSLSELPYSIDAVNVSISYDKVNATVKVSNPASTTQVTVSPTSL